MVRVLGVVPVAVMTVVVVAVAVVSTVVLVSMTVVSTTCLYCWALTNSYSTHFQVGVVMVILEVGIVVHVISS